MAWLASPHNRKLPVSSITSLLGFPHSQISTRSCRQTLRDFNSEVSQTGAESLESTLVAWDHLLTDTELALQRNVRQWIESTFKPSFIQGPRSAVLRAVKQLANLKALGTTIRYSDCPGMGHVAQGLLMQELARGDASLRSLCSSQTSLVMSSIADYGSQNQKDNFLPNLSTGKTIGCSGLFESAGSETVAEQDGNEYILNGVKKQVQNADFAELFLIWARVPKEDNVARGFLVQQDTPGLQVLPLPESGLLSCFRPGGVVELANCRVSREQVLPGASSLAAPLQAINDARLDAAWGATGAAIACYDAALQHGRSTGNVASQLYQKGLADMAGHIVRSQLMSLHYTRLKEMNELSPLQVKVLKKCNTEAARMVASIARPMLGSDALSNEFPVMRHLVNIEANASEDTTDEHQLMSIGHALIS